MTTETSLCILLTVTELLKRYQTKVSVQEYEVEAASDGRQLRSLVTKAWRYAHYMV